jgi:hypothetical protein
VNRRSFRQLNQAVGESTRTGYDPCALAGKGLRNGEPDAFAGTRDHRYLACEM